MILDLSSFKKAIVTLEEALNAYQHESENTFIRDACIQRFEYTYEITHKMIRRYLEMNESTAAVVADLSFPGLIRLAYARGLLHEEFVQWKAFREARNTTSHTYDEEKAHEVFESIPKFLTEAKFLYHEIQTRQDSEK
ncbi:MAG: nucleotidyltransferase substrate binding protein [Alphaproteobacteria bacterium]